MKRYNPQRDSNLFQLNIGTIIFGIIFIYMMIRIILSIQSETLSIYEVQNSYIDTNINATALILRQETLVNAVNSGYVSYYVRDGEKVGKNKTVYTIDETGSIYDKINDSGNDGLVMSPDGLKEVRTRISNFENYFKYSNFQEVYNFRYDIENAVLELTNEAMIEKLTSLDSNSAGASTYKKVQSDEAGIITYYKDGLENVNAENFKASNVDNSNYKKTTLKTGEIINSGEPVYKLVTSENWNLIIPLSDKQYNRIKDKEALRINIHNSSKNITCPVEFSDKEGKHFAILSLDQQMVNYINNRYIDVVIIMEQNNGLKIPNTSITTKKVYKIPIEYLSAGSNTSDSNHFNVETLDEKGNVTTKQINSNIYLTDEKYCYADPNDFTGSEVLLASETVKEDEIPNVTSNKTFSLADAAKEEIQGVYCVNQGVAAFRYIEIIYQDDEYTIVKENVPYSIAWYDRIVLNQSFVTENQIIK
ncbi:MAG: hypothetical protein IJ661_09105 [Lachnospiraceae bacterium]|nr:hypothetical protein [Lachnospiraceae bacterium]